ncbi:hypothetical protein ACETU6_21490 [Streptomyces sp. AGS-58]
MRSTTAYADTAPAAEVARRTAAAVAESATPTAGAVPACLAP